MSEIDDLDALIEGLGPSTRSAPPPAAAAPQQAKSSRLDLNDLESLMDDLGGGRPAAAPTPVQAVPKPMPAPQVVHAVPAPTPVPAPSGGGGEFDDLDSLMAGLSTKPTPAAAPVQAVPKPAPAPVQPVPVAQPPAPTPVQSVPRPQPAVNRPAPAPATGKDLDSLLNNLNTQIRSIDDPSGSGKPVCGTCGKQIFGEMMNALGKQYHPDCFVCGGCQVNLGTRNFFEVEGTPHCEKCYQGIHCPRCGHCDQPVLDKYINAIGKKWHVDCFVCTTCLKPIAGGTFFEREGRPYCEADFVAGYAPKCAACNQVIKGDSINAIGKTWCPEHFVCQYCQKAFGNAPYFEVNGLPYCEAHYHTQTGSICAGCNQTISGRFINACGKKWCPEHFVCGYCMTPLSGQSYSEKGDKAYCKDCHTRLFSA